MATLFFPDNTVLVNFAHINRISLLERLANGNGAWCATVAQECSQSAKVPELSALAQVPTVFGRPLFPTPAELVDIYTLREQMAGPGDERHKHLGEAETITIITSRNLKGFFVTDDRDAAKAAKAANVSVIDTWYLIKTAVKIGDITADEAWADTQTLIARKRGYPPCPRGRSAFDNWLKP